MRKRETANCGVDDAELLHMNRPISKSKKLCVCGTHGENKRRAAKKDYAKPWSSYNQKMKDKMGL